MTAPTDQFVDNANRRPEDGNDHGPHLSERTGMSAVIDRRRCDELVRAEVITYASRPGPRDLLRELDHEAVRVGDVQRAVAPGPISRLAQQRDPLRAQCGRRRVDVVDHEHDLARRSGVHRVAGQPLRTAALVDRQPRRPGPELGVSRVGEPVRETGHVAIEPHGRLQVGHVEDHVAQPRHRSTVAGGVDPDGRRLL